MKPIFVFFIAAALALTASAADKPDAGAPAKKAAPAPKTIQPLTIPKDAKPGENGTFKYTDKDGRKWSYSTTPFGISRVVDMGPAPGNYTAPVASKAIDLGDTVRFEQPGPFGVMHWEKKKTELSDEERQVFEKQKQTLDKQNSDQQKAEQK